MPARHLPPRPNLRQLKHQAKDLLRAVHRGDPSALADFRQYYAERIDPAKLTLADAQLVLARSYQAPSWPQLVLACRIIEATSRDDFDAARTGRGAPGATCAMIARSAFGTVISDVSVNPRV